MALSREEIRDIGIATAQHVLEGLGRYTKEYVPPSSIPQGLRDSMIEERTAGDWYRKRANMAKQLGDVDTVAVYEEVIKDEEDHYYKFGESGIGLGRLGMLKGNILPTLSEAGLDTWLYSYHIKKTTRQ